MPSKSPEQARLMAACAHGADYESCPPKKVAKEFNQADKKKVSFKEWVERPIETKVDIDVPGVVAKLAKKHNVSTDSINAQLKKGIKVEFEHTNQKTTATKIALDHLNEKPDYYTALSNMEDGKCDK